MSRRVHVRVRASARPGGVSCSERATGGGGRAGGAGAEGAHHLFDELLQRGSRAKISDVNRALTAVARDSPADAVSPCNRMARPGGGADRVAPDVCTYSLLVGCYCRVGRLDLGFANMRTSDAVDIVVRRMTELGCTPNVFSYDILLNGLCHEKRNQEQTVSLQLVS